MKRLSLLAWLGASMLVAPSVIFSAQTPPEAGMPDRKLPVDLGSRRELFVDRFLIDRLDGAALKLHKPEFAGPVLRMDRPWEGGGTCFFTIVKDGGIYRLYYVGCPVTSTNDDLDSYPCYAESRDGIAWTKPELGLCSFQGSTRNNILMLPNLVEPFPTNFAPFLDTRPGVAAEERFKAVGGGQPARALTSPITREGLWALASGDGIHWRKWRDAPVVVAEAMVGADGHDDFDMQNCAFWSKSEKCYVLYYRTAVDVPPETRNAGGGGCRSIARRTSPDFIHWSPPQRMGFGNTELEQVYTITTFPYPRAAHLYLSFPMRFVSGRHFLTERQYDGLSVLPLYKQADTSHDISDTIFMTSRGGDRYDRTFMEAFIRPGPDLGNWVARNGICARGLIQTGACELSLYCQSHYVQPSAFLGRYTVRLDGFASVNAPYAGGEMQTRPLVVSGRELLVNFATSAAGSLQVEVQDETGYPIPGFSLMESFDLVGDSIEYPVKWGRGHDLTALSGRAVRLRFVMKDADLYSMRFR